jgi:hypothetical protein
VENRGFEALEVPPKREKNEIQRSSIYRQNQVCCQVRGVLDRRWCDRLQSHMRSTVCSAFDRTVFDREMCD